MSTPYKKFFPAFSLAFFCALSPTQASLSIGEVGGMPQVERGGVCEIVVRGIVMPGEVAKFKVHKGPRHGELGGPDLRGKDTAVYTYRHTGKKGPESDRVEFRIKTGRNNTWGPVIASIAIVEPPTRLVVDPDELDFGPVAIGGRRVKTLQIRNGGGGHLQGALQLGIPWSIDGPGEFALDAGESRSFDVAFSPLAPEEQRGRLSIEMSPGRPAFIGLRGEGVYRFSVPERVSFEPLPGASSLEIPFSNLMGTPLELLIHAPAPLISDSILTLPPSGKASLWLSVQKKHFTEKFVELSIRDGDAVREVRVDLPPPPALLEWAHPNSTIDVGGIPFRTTVRPEPELRNLGAIAASVVLREGGGRWVLDQNQSRTIVIQPGETMKIRSTWRLPETPGPAIATLMASHGGIDHTLQARATVLPPETTTGAASVPVQSPTPDPVNFMSPGDRDGLARRMPSDIRSHTEADWWRHNSSTAFVSWARRDPSQVEYHFEILLPAGRESLIDRLAMSGQRFQVPGELPQTKPEFEWRQFPAGLQADGRWLSRIPGLSPGYYESRIVAFDRRKKMTETLKLRIFVPYTRWPPAGLQWLLAASAALLLAYLLRRTLRRLFRP